MTPAPEFLAVQNAYSDTPQCRTVRRAAEDYGSLERLARFIGSDLSDLEHWCAGDSLPPTAVFLKALDIVARGPWPKVRVCVLR